MSNVVKCPQPPGGSIRCSDDQLAVCGFQDGESISGCFDRPARLQYVSDEMERSLALANWAVSVITGSSRSEYDILGPDEIALLRQGEFRHEITGETVRFTLPRDLDLRYLVSRLRPA